MSKPQATTEQPSTLKRLTHIDDDKKTISKSQREQQNVFPFLTEANIDSTTWAGNFHPLVSGLNHTSGFIPPYLPTGTKTDILHRHPSNMSITVSSHINAGQGIMQVNQGVESTATSSSWATISSLLAEPPLHPVQDMSIHSKMASPIISTSDQLSSIPCGKSVGNGSQSNGPVQNVDVNATASAPRNTVKIIEEKPGIFDIKYTPVTESIQYTLSENTARNAIADMVSKNISEHCNANSKLPSDRSDLSTICPPLLRKPFVQQMQSIAPKSDFPDFQSTNPHPVGAPVPNFYATAVRYSPIMAKRPVGIKQYLPEELGMAILLKNISNPSETAQCNGPMPVKPVINAAPPESKINRKSAETTNTTTDPAKTDNIDQLSSATNTKLDTRNVLPDNEINFELTVAPKPLSSSNGPSETKTTTSTVGSSPNSVATTLRISPETLPSGGKPCFVPINLHEGQATSSTCNIPLTPLVPPAGQVALLPVPPASPVGQVVPATSIEQVTPVPLLTSSGQVTPSHQGTALQGRSSTPRRVNMLCSRLPSLTESPIISPALANGIQSTVSSTNTSPEIIFNSDSNN